MSFCYITLYNRYICYITRYLCYITLRYITWHISNQEHQKHQEQQEQQVRGQQVRGQKIPIPAKSIEKLISQNFKILSKFDTLISAQQLIDNRLKKIEGSL